MCIARCVLALMALHVGVAHSWDIAISVKEQLIFYTNGTKTNTVNLISQNPTALVYDEVHNMMLYVDKQSNNDAICGYDLSSKDNKCFIKRNGRNIHGLAYDPVTEIIFFTDKNERSINFISMKRGSINNIYGNLLIKLDDLDQIPTDVVVDSCKGYIYWTRISKENRKGWQLERAQFNGSERRIMFRSGNYGQFSLVIDPQTQNMFYFDVCKTCDDWIGFIYSNNYSGTNATSLFEGFEHLNSVSKLLTVSKDYIYWMNSSESYGTVLQFPKTVDHSTLKPQEIIKFYNEISLGITAKYTMHDQFFGMKDCDSLSSLMTAKSLMTPNTVVCENHCMHGNCSLNDEGLPKCSCNPGFTGERCEVPACHGYCLNDGSCSLHESSDPVCQCKGDYSGDRCEITDCLNYCMQGNCSFNNEGRPTCSCNAGYSGERCDVNVCFNFCLNDGECSLNEEDEPVCQCVNNHEGSRCEADIKDTTPTYDLAKKNLTLVDLISTWRKPSSKMYVVVEV